MVTVQVSTLASLRKVRSISTYLHNMNEFTVWKTEGDHHPLNHTSMQYQSHDEIGDSC